MPSKRGATASGVKGAQKAPRKPRAAKKTTEAAAAGGRLRVRQIRSGIGHAATYRRTLTALGLKHHQDEVVVRDVPSVQGMLRKVWNFVSVRPVEG